MLPESIENFDKQFKFEPEIINSDGFKLGKEFILVGMGGSHLAGDLLKGFDPKLPLLIYSDYHLPALPMEVLKESTIILSSFSGNTQETLSALSECLNRGLNPMIVATGGVLLEKAKEKSLPYIQIPDDFPEPRLAIGYMTKALLKIFEKEDVLKDTEIDNENIKSQARDLAMQLKGHVPVIYASQKNSGVAYNWKVAFNETSKIPAFLSILPEANHPDLNGMDIKNQTRELSKNFKIIFLLDEEDDEEIKERFKITQDFYAKEELNILDVALVGQGMEKIFSAVLLGHWLAFYLDKEYGADPNAHLASEEFKKELGK